MSAPVAGFAVLHAEQLAIKCAIGRLCSPTQAGRILRSVAVQGVAVGVPVMRDLVRMTLLVTRIHEHR